MRATQKPSGGKPPRVLCAFAGMNGKACRMQLCLLMGALIGACCFCTLGSPGAAFAAKSSVRLHDAVTHDYDDMSYDDYYDPDRMDRSDPGWDDDESGEEDAEE